ncbi:threonine synthase [Methanolapillus millepedarum]|uniref:Threonine synthase n=1 Tax=Methanolapillus millepedarum TaxID=3028296 RepID=A0AA96V2B6_9EURY|nr:Threonine synthase [Methanosarcinaceae archaeon Ac7]
MEYYLKCIECGAEFDKKEIIYTCQKCNGLLDVIYDYNEIKKNMDMNKLKTEAPSVWKYKDLLPVGIEPVSIREGGTPLYKCDRLAKKIGIRELYVKHEGMNPTGSFKDRGMTVGVSKAIELGMKTVACASTGNTSAALAIYGAKAGIPSVVLLPAGKVALGKIGQALMHGAKVIMIKGNFDDALLLVRELCDQEPIYLLNSINPYRLEGQKTIAFEIVDQLGFKVPDRVVLPVGNAGNITAINKGFKEFMTLGITNRRPKMTGIQTEGASPIVKAIKSGADDITPEKNPETIATAIRIGDPVNARKALAAIRESGGTAESVTDDELIQAQKDLAQLEGIGVEPASATSVAGLKKLVDLGVISKDETVVCVTTGHLLKDPEEVISVCIEPVVVEPTIEALRKAIFS